MAFIADLHVHSRFSRATSRDADLAGYYRWAKAKGIALVGTGDFTHPGWFSEISGLLTEEDGLFRFIEPPSGSALSSGSPADLAVRFILTAEISSIYKKSGRTRKIHSLLMVPSLEAAKRLNRKLAALGNISSDGRPILGLDPKDLLAMLLEVSPEAIFIPAHIWTPWFSLFGSKSGFDRIEDCFEELTPHITALETGLSSDPAMNRRWSALDRFRLVSNSDAHSPNNLGREANLLDTGLSFHGVREALSMGEGFLGTFEFYPQEGKYHADGHRKCGVCMDPEETARCGGLCPACGKLLTVGVLNRVLHLADRAAGAEPARREQYRSLIPLAEILSELLGAGPSSKAVASLYERMVCSFGSEFAVLFDAPIRDIERSFGRLAAEAISRMREGKVHASPGYDGEFGKIRVFSEGEIERLKGQDELFAFAASSRTRRGASRVESPLLQASEPRDGRPGGDGVTAALNDAQRDITGVRSGVSLVFAGPGTGKTRALTHWVADRIAEHGRGALAITFTNRAAREMRERLSALGCKMDKVEVSTFHAFCFSLLRDHDPGLIDIYSAVQREDLLRLILPAEQSGRAREISERIEKHYEGTGEADPGLVDAIDVYEKTLEKIGAVDLSSIVGRAADLLDNDHEAAERVRERIHYIAVDELQDVNPGQYRLLELLIGDEASHRGRAVLCIGDPDQAIYGFRGSDRGLFFRFRERAGRVFTLTSTYRSTSTIIDAARAVLDAGGASCGPEAQSTGREPLRPMRPSGEAIGVFGAEDPNEEGAFIAEEISMLLGGVDSISAAASGDNEQGYSFADVAVLFRTRAVRDSLLPSLSKAGIPVTIGDNTPLHAEKPFTYLIAALRLLQNPRDAASTARLLDHLEPGRPGRKAAPLILGGEKRIEELPEALESAGAISPFSRGRLERLLCGREALMSSLSGGGVSAVIDELLSGTVLFERGDARIEAGEELIRESAREFGSDLAGFLRQLSLLSVENEGSYRSEKVRLLTFHAAKGIEFPIVFLTGAEEGMVPMGDDRDEERRLFYVAITRAKDRLFISHCRRRFLHGLWTEMKPSPFLEDIPSALKARAAARKRRADPSTGQLALFV
jgi:DNA helicase-2/ATP-dependent DNA helicase PcrA